MDVIKRQALRPFLIFFTVTVVLFAGCNRASSSERINPLRLGEDTKSWQLTLNFSRFVDSITVLDRGSTGLWEEEKTIYGSRYSIKSYLDLTKRVGFRGGFTYRRDSVKSVETNLWTGARKTTQDESSGPGDASFKVKVKIWENSELRTNLLVPVFGGSAGVGLIWSSDPVMILPKFTTDGKSFGVKTGVSFVANPKIALTGKAEFRKEKEGLLVGFGGGFVYRGGKYDGVQVSASLQQGRSVRVSLEVSFSYGCEKG